jgi:hypothetical protein
VNATSKLHVLGSDGDTLCMDRAEVCLIKETDEIHLGGLLEGEHSRGLEAKYGHSNQSREFLLILHHNFEHNLFLMRH